MTDEQIIIALECCCGVNGFSCGNCTRLDDLYGESTTECMEGLVRDALSLINRQKAEIKEWRRVVDTWVITHEKDKAEIERLKGWEAFIKSEKNALIRREAKADAIKEFAERLKSKASDFEFGKAVWVVYIDNLVKEMVGGSDG